MPSGGPGNHQEVTAAVTLVTTAETVIAFVPNPTAGPPAAGEPYVPGFGPCIVSGVVNVTGGTSTTSATIRVRQNTLTGAVVGNVSSAPVTGAQVFSIPFETLDATGAAGYVVTAQLAGAAANGSATASVDATPQ